MIMKAVFLQFETSLFLEIISCIKTPQGYSNESSIYDASPEYLCGVFCSVVIFYPMKSTR